MLFLIKHSLLLPMSVEYGVTPKTARVMMQHFKHEETNRYIRDSLDPVKERYKDLQLSILTTAATPVTQTEPAKSAQPTEQTFASLVVTAPLQIHSVVDASNPQRVFVAPFISPEKTKIRRIKANQEERTRSLQTCNTCGHYSNGSVHTTFNTMSATPVLRQPQIVCRACFRDGVNVLSVESFSLKNLQPSELRTYLHNHLIKLCSLP